ncbi:polysaccharide deacetylase family protein [Pseudoalteromonas sp. JBTF-M23]|uniref:Polysaccharide deacetylase family protein n=1 Tax=Pseudoalteromonas caenipelagi TaxID=2726988 RepID=A0A849VJE2_9GAMM|nr:polysaccharide deacetylase family protein [Pseudoalteromonas caenipelagi]NOU52768.1 polysaccharide deacetylase family protein [Pseudoalteromonas caenipelagi]
MAKKLLHLFTLFFLLKVTFADAAVILQYHHVSEKLPPVTSISSQQFTEHMSYLKEGNFNVMALDKMLQALQAGQTLPPKSVAITFDDGYDNNIEQAAPILEMFGFPYTIFVNPKLIDEKQHYLMSWEQLRRLANKGALIANHSAKHDYLHLHLDNETKEQWHKRVAQDITWSEGRIASEIGHNTKLLAYPYGEFSTELQQLVRSLGFIGIGQHSGAVGKHTDFTRVPRFPASGVYAALSTLSVKLHAHPFAIKKLSYQNSVTTNHQPELTIDFESVDFSQHQFTCYVSGQGVANTKWLALNTVSIRAKEQLPTGRSRYNCTAPLKTGKSKQFYWFSQPWVVTTP